MSAVSGSIILTLSKGDPTEYVERGAVPACWVLVGVVTVGSDDVGALAHMQSLTGSRHYAKIKGKQVQPLERSVIDDARSAWDAAAGSSFTFQHPDNLGKTGVWPSGYGHAQKTMYLTPLEVDCDSPDYVKLQCAEPAHSYMSAWCRLSQRLDIKLEGAV